jgi:hypothetical protein
MVEPLMAGAVDALGVISAITLVDTLDATVLPAELVAVT